MAYHYSSPNANPLLFWGLHVPELGEVTTCSRRRLRDLLLPDQLEELSTQTKQRRKRPSHLTHNITYMSVEYNQTLLVLPATRCFVFHPGRLPREHCHSWLRTAGAVQVGDDL